MNINSNINNNNIILIYNIDTDIYNKKIINELNKDINSICNIFDSICIDVLIKLFIMYKREKRSKYKKFYEPYIKIILKLKKMEYINIREYFQFIINILRIIKKKSKIEKFIFLSYNNDINNDSTNDKYINITYLNDKLIQVINSIAKDNLIVKNILDIHENKKGNNTDYIIKLSTFLCSEFYYLYNAIEMYDIIKSVITINKNGKHEFIKSYNDTNEKLIYIYENDNSQIKNYKLECNKSLIFEILKKVKSILKSNNI
jgi:hypothetical protein